MGEKTNFSKLFIVFLGAVTIYLFFQTFLITPIRRAAYFEAFVTTLQPLRTKSIWTQFPSGMPTYYVSDSLGDDVWDGTAPTYTGNNHGPEKTVQAGLDDLCNGGGNGSACANKLLFRAGDTWINQLINLKKSGDVSPGQWLVLGNYREPGNTSMARPLFKTGANSGIVLLGGGGAPSVFRNVAFVGLAFTPHTYTGLEDAVYGFFALQPVENLLIEDSEFYGFQTGIVIQQFGVTPNHKNVRVNGIVSRNNYHLEPIHSQGAYFYGVDGLIIKNSVFYHNGWDENVSGAVATIFNHNIYIDNGNSGVVLSNNIIADGASHGLQARSGGNVQNNLFVRNSIGLVAGGGNNPHPLGVTANINNNVIIDSKNIDATNPRGWGMVFTNITSGEVNNNLVVHNTIGSQPAAITLEADHVGENGLLDFGIHNLSFLGNVIYEWGGAIEIKGNSILRINGIQLLGNDFSDMVTVLPLFWHTNPITIGAITGSADNRFRSALNTNAWIEEGGVLESLDVWKSHLTPPDTTSAAFNPIPPTYPDPDRSVASYNASIGGQRSYEEFIARIINRPLGVWNPLRSASAVNYYLREGFGK